MLRAEGRAGLCQEPFRGWGTHLGEAGGEEDTLKELAHSLKKLIHVGPLQHVDLGGGPVRGLLAHRLGRGGRGAGRELVDEAEEHSGQAGPKPCKGPTWPVTPTAAGQTTILPEEGQNEALAHSRLGESLIPVPFPQHCFTLMEEPGGSPLTPRLQGTGPRAK